FALEPVVINLCSAAMLEKMSERVKHGRRRRAAGREEVEFVVGDPGTTALEVLGAEPEQVGHRLAVIESRPGTEPGRDMRIGATASEAEFDPEVLDEHGGGGRVVSRRNRRERAHGDAALSASVIRAQFE